MRFKFISFLFLILLVLTFCSGRRTPRTEPLPLEHRPDEISKETSTTQKPTIETEQPEVDLGTKIKISPVKPVDVVETGIASWYGGKFHGRRTANGEVYDKNKLTAAHQTLAFNTIVEVENLENRRKVIVRINDRGPFVKGRIIDLSREAAKRLGMVAGGTAPVCLRIHRPGKMTGDSRRPSSHASFYIQAGAYKIRENARNVLSRLQAAGFPVSFSIQYRNGFYRVLSGEIPDRRQADTIRRKIEALGIDSYVREYF